MLDTLQGPGWILDGNLTFSSWGVWAGGACGGTQWSPTMSPGTYGCPYRRLLNGAHVLAFLWFLLANK